MSTDPTPEQIAAAIAYVRSWSGPGSTAEILLHTLDAITAERDGLAREVAHLRERLAHRAALALEPDDYAGIARLSQ